MILDTAGLVQPKTAGLNLAIARLRRFDDGEWIGSARWYGDHGYRTRCQTQSTGIGGRLTSYEDAYIAICREVFSHDAAVEYVSELEPRLVGSFGITVVHLHRADDGRWYATVGKQWDDIEQTIVTPLYTSWKHAWIDGCETAFANRQAVSGVYGAPEPLPTTPPQLIRARNLLREYEREARGHDLPPAKHEMLKELDHAIEKLGRFHDRD